MWSTDRLLPWRAVQAVLVAGDAAALALAAFVAYQGRFDLEILPPRQADLGALVLCGACTLVAQQAFGLYGMRAVGSGYEEYRRLAMSTTAGVGAAVFITYLDATLRISRGFLVIFWACSLCLLVVSRFAIRRWVRHLARRGVPLRRVLIVGANAHGVALAQELATNAVASSQVVGFVDEYKTRGAEVAGLTVLGEPMHLYEVARTARATHAVVVESALSWESLRFVLRSMHRQRSVEVLLAPGTFDVMATPLELTQVGSALLLASHATRIVGLEAMLKRALDLAIVVPVLILSLPVQGAILAYLMATGQRPFVREQARGRLGRPITLVSFWGDRLHANHLSRLPSLWLVLAGQMSVIGPRAILESDVARYQAWYEILTTLKPGFIGPWWLAGRGKPADLEDEVEVDLRYARAYTLWMDLRILGGVALAIVRERLGGTPVHVPVERPSSGKSQSPSPGREAFRAGSGAGAVRIEVAESRHESR